MKINKHIKIALVVVLCLAMLLPFIPAKYSPVAVEADAAPVNFAKENIGEALKGKKLSILGDSISTYAGVSNDSNSNSTISGNAVYYTENNSYGVERADTWWQQAIDMLDMQLCVNNSWSGSTCMGAYSTTSGTAWVSRCKELDNDRTGNPDFIAVYMGTNDVKNATKSFDTFANNKDTMLAQAKTLETTPNASVKEFSKYIYMVNQMKAAYPDAQIYLFTLLPNEAQNDIQVQVMEQYNQSIRDLVTYYQTEVDNTVGAVNDKDNPHKVVLVDLYNDTGITSDIEVLKTHLANTLHPNDAGMDAITNCFLSELVCESGLATNPGNWRDVEYDLTDVYVSGGQINTIRSSGSTDVPFTVTLKPTRAEYGLEVKVEAIDYDSVWHDLTSSTYSGGTVYLARLIRTQYWKLRITAKATYETKNFRWELNTTGTNGLESCVADGTDYSILGELDTNNLSLLNGSYANGTFTNAQYSLADTILLRNEEPWVIEWKAKGAFSKGQLLFSGSDTSTTRSNNYIYSDNGRKLYIGYRNGYRSEYWNYGIAIPDSYVLNNNTNHIYRLANVIADDGSNMIYLSVDGNLIGAMNNYAIGATMQNTTQNWLNGRDLEFSFFGSGTSHYLNDCSIEYIQVWEGGEFDIVRLQQLVEEFDELSVTMSGATGFSAYQTAVNAAKSYLAKQDASNSQAKYNQLVADILTARNNLTKSADESKIYSAELINSNYVPIGTPAGLKVVTSPDIVKLQLGNTAGNINFLTNSCSLQTIGIDGVETEVKVWLVTWLRSDSTSKRIEYRLHAMTTDREASKDNPGEASMLVSIPYGRAWADVSDVIGNEGAYIEQEIVIEGVYVGVAHEGLNADVEILVKDPETDDIIAVRGVPGTFPDYGYTYGNKVNIIGTLKLDGTEHTPNKYYLQWSDDNADVSSTIASNNVVDVTYELNDVIEVSSWNEMQGLFVAGRIQEYTYIKFTGTMYFNKYTGSDTVNYRLHMNPDATSSDTDTIKSDGRGICLRDDVMTKILGSDWLSTYFGLSAKTSYPGAQFDGEFYALYTGANGAYFQLVVLDPSWISAS